MNAILSIFKKEWHCFKGSEKGVFIVYSILLFVWSFFPLNNVSTVAMSGSLWWLFFSVIISGNFASTVFVAERLSGSMEILLTSGYSRNAVLFGKMLFVMTLSIVIGILCLGLSFVWIMVSGHSQIAFGQAIFFAALVYSAGTFMNAASGAWLSVVLSSPRLLPFINVLVVGMICAIYSALHIFCGFAEWQLGLLLIIAGFVFLQLAKKEFNSEKIVAPLDV